MITDKREAYTKYPNLNWIYHKIELLKYLKQGGSVINYRPDYDHDFPVIVKPLMNLRPYPVCLKKVFSQKEYFDVIESGYMWTPYYTGTHYAYQEYYEDGELQWCRRSIKHIKLNTISVVERQEFIIEKFQRLHKIKKFATDYLKDYTGPLFYETVDSDILSISLTMDPRGIDFYTGHEREGNSFTLLKPPSDEQLNIWRNDPNVVGIHLLSLDRLIIKSIELPIYGYVNILY